MSYDPVSGRFDCRPPDYLDPSSGSCWPVSSACDQDRKPSANRKPPSRKQQAVFLTLIIVLVALIWLPHVDELF